MPVRKLLVTVPDSLIANRFDEILHMRLCEVLIIELDQLGVNSWHGHEHVNHRSRGAQQHLPHLRTHTQTDKQNILLRREGEEDKERLRENRP